ncbi:MAG: SDR family NAD(P)-dependent oxidoreductase [Lachnospiraceae bacterium]|jgi:short-subunit dehydrogenase
MEKKVAVVTGGTSGIGLETAKALAASGCMVYTISRRKTGAGGLKHISCDITDEASVEKTVDSILKSEGRIDILINCAGFGIAGAIEFTGTADAKKQFDVNFFGMVCVTKEVLHSMRERGSGRIVNISSVAAQASIPFQAYYSASKAAVNSYSASLANEMKSFGISVTAVMPGDINTGFTEARESTFSGDDVFGGTIRRSIGKMEKDEKNGMDPGTAGRYIAGIALRKKVKPLYAVGGLYKFLCFLLKILPCKLVNRIIEIMYM